MLKFVTQVRDEIHLWKGGGVVGDVQCDEWKGCP